MLLDYIKGYDYFSCSSILDLIEAEWQKVAEQKVLYENSLLILNARSCDGPSFFNDFDMPVHPQFVID